jgi:hypothetical protein
MRNPEPKFQQENHGRVAIFFVAAGVSLALSMMTWRGAALDNTRVWSLWEQSNIESAADAAVIPADLLPAPDKTRAASPVASATPGYVAGMKHRRANHAEIRDYSRARDALLQIFATSIETARHH